MSNHIKIDEDFVKALLKDAAWDKAIVSVKEEDETVKVEEAEKVEEAQEHVCPLCESQLDEAISDEAVLEHVDMIQNLLTEADKERKSVGDLKDEDEVEVETDEEVTEAEDEDEDVEETNKAKIKEKVSKLKEKWSGQKKGDKSKTDKGKDFEKKA